MLQKEEEELSKLGSGIGKVFLQEVREREKHQKWKVSHIDPRNASRCPSAAREPAYRLRYQSPINACKLYPMVESNVSLELYCFTVSRLIITLQIETGFSCLTCVFF